MCQACSKWFSDIPGAADEFGVKQMPMQSELQPLALARFTRAQGVTDSDKLTAMLPAWIKAHNRATYPSKRAAFVPGLPARFIVLTSAPVMPSSLAHVGKVGRVIADKAPAVIPVPVIVPVAAPVVVPVSVPVVVPVVRARVKRYAITQDGRRIAA